MSRSLRTHRRTRAFTLTELLIASTIAGITLGLLLPFFVFNLRSVFHGEQKLLINGDIRDLTNTMMENARESNYFALYQSFYAQNSTTGTAVSRDSTADGLVNELDRRTDNQGGDFLILVYTENNGIYDSRFYDNIANNEPANLTRVTRIVGYWIAQNHVTPTNKDGSARNALYSFDTQRFKTSPTATSWTTSWGATCPVVLNAVTTLESLLPPATQNAARDTAYARILIQDLIGRAGQGLNFVNFSNKTVIVQSRVLHGHRAKRVTNTYNFAVTPRG